MKRIYQILLAILALAFMTSCDGYTGTEAKEGVIVISNYGLDASPISYYDGDGNIYRQENVFEDSTMNFAKDYSYNAEGLLSEIKYSSGGRTSFSYINKVISKIEDYSSSDELNHYTEFEILNDILISGESHFPNDTSELKRSYHYSHGKLDTISYSLLFSISNFEYKSKTAFEYDDNGNIVVSSNYANNSNSSGVVLNYRVVNYYNSNNKIILSERYARDNRLTGSMKFFYNSIGNLKEVKYLDSSGEMIDFMTYEYSGDESIVLKDIELSLYH